FMYLNHGIQVGHDMQQAICIARALLKDPRIVLLDSPTFYTQKHKDHFYKLIKQCRGNRTVLIASHDREVLECCDKVLLLAQGVPVSFGTMSRASQDNTPPVTGKPKKTE
ncbi:MAG: hypothetical protein PQJ28_03560, partial [Spirochaetales bacterium]|nr:hypothetical protein [Spirochaetales bacterium]